MTVMTEPRFHR